jgi:hypothetical protein
MSDITVQLVCRNQLGLSRIPLLEDPGRRGAAEDSRVDEPGKLDVRNVAARAIDAFEIPDCFGTR